MGGSEAGAGGGSAGSATLSPGYREARSCARARAASADENVGPNGVVPSSVTAQPFGVCTQLTSRDGAAGVKGSTSFTYRGVYWRGAAAGAGAGAGGGSGAPGAGGGTIR